MFAVRVAGREGRQTHVDCPMRCDWCHNGDLAERTKEGEINATQVGKIQGRCIETNGREEKRDGVREDPGQTRLVLHYLSCLSHFLFVLVAIRCLKAKTNLGGLAWLTLSLSQWSPFFRSLP